MRRRWRNAARRGSSRPPASCAATAPTKQSPAPVVSTAFTARPAMIVGSPSISASTPRLPSVTQMILSLPIGSERAASMKRAGSSLSLKLGFCQKAEFGLVEDQDIDEIEQLSAEVDRRRRIEDGGRAGRAGALEEGGDRGLRNFELADRDVALGEHRRGDIRRAHQRIGAGNDDDGVVGIGDGDDGRSGMGVRGVLHETRGRRPVRRGTPSTARRTHPCRAGRSASSVRRVLPPPPPGWRPCRRENRAAAVPATVSPMRGCRSAVATTSMLMLPATKTRPMFYS